MKQASWNVRIAPEANMNILNKVKDAMRGVIQRRGSSRMKRRLWNQEFAKGRWDFIENTSADLIYEYIGKYCRNGSILDLGCGSGNTGCELEANSYRDYTGVDISDVAIEKAIQRSVANHRDKKNHYQQSDITTFTPSQKFNVILFRESVYYIPRPQIKSVLDHYSSFLESGGVFIVRCYNQEQGEAILELLDNVYTMVEKNVPTAAGATIYILQRKTAMPV
jgi:2-polyprenyl-3-methyl-5-hydroxy-6-metoxy-1,4-benzoquinol methylase